MTGSIQEQAEHLGQGIEIMIPPGGLAQKLTLAEKEGRPLVVKLGFDPTAPDLHIGHAVVLKKMREFQQAGHKVVVIVGDFTTKIGDPTGRNTLRPPLTDAQIEENAKTYIEQLGKILDISKIEVRRNSDWLSPMTFADVIRVVSKVTLAQLLQREDFSNRYAGNIPIHMHELLYPMVQGQDSVEIKADIEMGGTDQLFNCQMGRVLQEHNGMPAQIVLSMPLLVGLDGKDKMSKSKKNYIGLTDAPGDMYGKAMSIPDEALPSYLDLATNFAVEEVRAIKAGLVDGSAHPMDIKKKIAKNIVAQYHDAAAAEAAENYFVAQFQNKDAEKKAYKPLRFADAEGGAGVAVSLLSLCVAAEPTLSKSQIRRLIADNAVAVDGVKITDPNAMIQTNNGDVKIKIGKMGFFVFQG